MNINDRTFEDLARLLEEEAEIYGRMSELLMREREALIGLEVSELGEISSHKETLGLRIKALDESRKVLSERMGRHFGIAPGELTVSALCEFAPETMRARLIDVRDRLKALAIECRHVNEDNARAARRGLELVNGTIDYVIKEADPAGKVYQKKGGYGGQTQKQPAFVSRQI